MDIWVSYPVGPSRSFELSTTSHECISRSLCVVVEVVLLDVLDVVSQLLHTVAIGTPLHQTVFILTKTTHQGEFLAQIHPMMHLDEIPIDLYSEDYLIDNT